MRNYVSIVVTALVIGVASNDSARAQGVIVFPHPGQTNWPVRPWQSPLVTTLLPEASGTVKFWPELGVWVVNSGHSGDAQSGYFRTTAENREFRRGFLEFSIPDFSGTLVSATLLLADCCGWTSVPLPPDTHELDYYEADLVVNTNDYHATAEPLAEFETDNNISSENFSFDLTSVVDEFRGRNLGLRIKLAVDPDYFGEGFLGTGFQNNFQASPARIVLVRSNVPPATTTVTLKTARAAAFEPSGRHRTQDGLFVVHRTGSTDTAIQVACAVGGTAQNGTDYESIASVILIPAGATSATVAVRPLADRVRERPETVTLHLLPSPGGSYELAPRAEGRVIIIDRSHVTR